MHWGLDSSHQPSTRFLLRFSTMSSPRIGSENWLRHSRHGSSFGVDKDDICVRSSIGVHGPVQWRITKWRDRPAASLNLKTMSWGWIKKLDDVETRRRYVEGLHVMGSGYRNLRKLPTYALASSLRKSVILNYGEYPSPHAATVDKKKVIHHFHGTEDTKQSKHWLTSFGRWACQERLSAEERLLIAVLAMVDEAARWCKAYLLEYATYKEFCFLFAETFIRKICLWGGSSVYPYYLEFDGISKGNPGHAGIGAVLTTPNQEHDFGQVSLYIGSKSTKHLAQYEALIAGLETALTCGVKCLHACSDNMLIVNQVTKLWKSPADPELKFCLSKVWFLAAELDNFEINFQSEKRYNGVATRLAWEAVQNFLMKLERMTQKIKKDTHSVNAKNKVQTSKTKIAAKKNALSKHAPDCPRSGPR